MGTIQTLASVGLFEGVPADALAAIADLCHEKSFDAGTIICAEGHSADLIYLLQGGTVGLFVSPTSRPTPLTVSLLETPGQAFGWSALVGSGFYTAAAQAVTDVRAVGLDGRALVAYLEQDPAAGYVVMKRVAQVVSYRLGIMRSLVLETACN
jgi:CRP-like cAMP-binding protein